MSTEYTFDGLDEWEKNLAQIHGTQVAVDLRDVVEFK